MTSTQPETGKGLLCLEEFGYRKFEISGSSLNRSSTSFLSGIGSDFDGDDSNFLVNLDSVSKENGPDYNTVLNNIQERSNGELGNAATSTLNIGKNGVEVYENSKESSENKENIPTGEACSTLSDLNIFIPPPLVQKKFMKPTLPSILELSYEEGMKAQSLATSRSSSTSTIYEYVNSADKPDMPGTRDKLTKEREDHPQSNAKPDAWARSKDAKIKFNDSGKFVKNSRVPPVPKYTSNSGALKESQAKSDSWDAFDKAMEKSFVADDYSRFEQLSVTQRDLELDDAGFQSFTSLEAQELMDKDEAERLQLLTSANGTFLESFLNGNEENVFDKNMSMGAYFGPRSSAPFKISELSFSKNISNRSPLSRNDSLFTTSPHTDDPIKTKNVSPTESYQSLRDDDECEPLKLPDTSLDTLAKFFMGPESKYLSGNPDGMMEYVIDYCRQKAEKTLPLNHVKDASITDSNDRNEVSQFVVSNVHKEKSPFVNSNSSKQKFQFVNSSDHKEKSQFVHPNDRKEKSQLVHSNDHKEKSQFVHPNDHKEKSQPVHSNDHKEKSQLVHSNDHKEKSQFVHPNDHKEKSQPVHSTDHKEKSQFVHPNDRKEKSQPVHSNDHKEKSQLKNPKDHQEKSQHVDPNNRKDKSQLATRNDDKENSQFVKPNDLKERSPSVTSLSSASSSGVSSSFESNKTLTPKKDSKTSRNDDCSDQNYRKYQDSEHTEDRSVVIAGHGLSRPSFGISESILEMESTFDNARYAKFEENLKKSIHDRPAHLDRLSEREYQVPLRNHSEKQVPSNSVSNAKPMTLELLRKESLSPPERLRSQTYDKGSALSLGNNSGGAHSTPVQQQSLSASLAKQLGFRNISSTQDSPSLSSEPLEFNDKDITNLPAAEGYNFLNGDKIVNSNRIGAQSNYIQNSSMAKSSNRNYNVNDANSGKETVAVKHLNRFEDVNVTEPILHEEEEFYDPGFKNLSALEVMNREQAERSKYELPLSSFYGISTRESTPASFPKTNPHVNQVGSNAVVKRSTNTRSTDSGVQTSFMQPKSVNSAVAPMPMSSFNQGGNINQLVQAQNFGYPLIIQIHCACNGGVNVVSNQPSSSAFAQTASATHTHQKYIETPRQALQLKEPIPVEGSTVLELPLQNVEKDKLVAKGVALAEKQKGGPPQAFIEVDKMSLIWGFVDFGKTVMNTVCLSNKQDVELRFRAIIVERSYAKNFKFVLDPHDIRIKETERVGVLRPFASKQLKINFSPVNEGNISGSIQLRFHSVPFTDLGFRGEIPLIVTETFSGGQKKTTKSATNTSRAGDDIKIVNTNINFGRLVLGNTSRKVTTITNNGSSTIRFVVSPPRVTMIDGKLAEDNPFSSSVSEGTIAKGATREIIFGYKPGYYGKHSQNWTVDVIFVYSSIQMTKSTRIVLEGECAKLA